MAAVIVTAEPPAFEEDDFHHVTRSQAASPAMQSRQRRNSSQSDSSLPTSRRSSISSSSSSSASTSKAIAKTQSSPDTDMPCTCDAAVDVVAQATTAPIRSSQFVVQRKLKPEMTPFITDIVVINETNFEVCPPHYEQIAKNLNAGTLGGDDLYLCYSRQSGKIPITELHIIYPDNNQGRAIESIPDGFELIDVDLCKGAGGRDCYLVVGRGLSCPLTDIKVFSSPHQPPKDYRVLWRDCKLETAGSGLYIAYRRALDDVERFAPAESVRPITHLMVAVPGSSIPEGFDPIPFGVTSVESDANADRWATRWVCAVKRTRGASPITDVLALPSAAAEVPAHYTLVDIAGGGSAGGVSGSEAKTPLGHAPTLCVTREPGAAPIIEMKLFWVDKEDPPKGYFVLPVDLNANVKNSRKGGAPKVNLCFKKAPIAIHTELFVPTPVLGDK